MNATKDTLKEIIDFAQVHPVATFFMGVALMGWAGTLVRSLLVPCELIGSR